MDFQEYNSRKLTNLGEHAMKAVMYACPYANDADIQSNLEW